MSCTVYRKYLAGEKLANLANREPFAKISSPIVTDASKMYFAYALTVAYLTNFSLPIAFTCMVCQTFSCQIFAEYSKHCT